jgi:prefoldin subunit 5
MKKMNDRGFNDLERTIERLEKRIEDLKQDNKTLVKEIDRLSEENNNLHVIYGKK